MRTPTIDRFNAKVTRRDGGCWEWTAKRNRDGYGAFWCGSNNDKGQPIQVLAHRWAYEHFIGAIPNGARVCHSCDHPWCVNPDHLFVGTQLDNVHDAIRKGRHRNGRAALTQEQARMIRAEHQGRYGDITRLAAKYGASKKTILRVVHGKQAWSRPA